MKQFNKSLLMLTILCFCFSVPSLAQEDDLQEEEKSYDSEKDSGKIENDLSKTELVRIRRSYKMGDGITFTSNSGSLNITQSVQTLYNVATPDDFNSYLSEFRIRRARMKFSGRAFDDKLYFRMRLDFAGNYKSPTSGNREYNPVLQDAYLEYRPTKNQRLSIGLRADYIDTRETRFEGEVLGFVERSAISSAFDAIFDFGLRYSATYRIHNKHLLKPYVSITTGEGNAALQQNFEGLKYGVRLDYLPFGAFSKLGEFYMEELAGERKPKLVLGGVFSYSDGISSVKGANGGRYIYGDKNQNVLYPDYVKFGADYLFKYRGFYSLGTFVTTKSNVPDGIAGEFRLNGTFSPYPATDTPEQIKNRVLGRINIGYGYNFQAGYLLPSQVSFGLRYSHLYQDEKSAAFASSDNFYSLVSTKYFSGNALKLQAEIGYQEYAIPTPLAKGSYIAQLMLTVEL